MYNYDEFKDSLQRHNFGIFVTELNFDNFKDLDIIFEEIHQVEISQYSSNYYEYGKNYVMEQCNIDSDINVMSYIDFEKFSFDLLKDKNYIFTDNHCIIYEGQNENMFEVLNEYVRVQNGEMEICN